MADWAALLENKPLRTARTLRINELKLQTGRLWHWLNWHRNENSSGEIKLSTQAGYYYSVLAGYVVQQIHPVTSKRENVLPMPAFSFNIPFIFEKQIFFAANLYSRQASDVVYGGRCLCIIERTGSKRLKYLHVDDTVDVMQLPTSNCVIYKRVDDWCSILFENSFELGHKINYILYTKICKPYASKCIDNSWDTTY